MSHYSRKLFTLCVALSAAVFTVVRAAVPYPDAATPKAVDRGALESLAATTPLSITVALRLTDVGAAEALLQSIYTPGDPQFRQFLTGEQFVARFAPSDADVAKVVASLAKYGLTAERSTATTLHVTGMPADMERAFAVSLHSYEVPAHGNVPGYTYYSPLTHATIPAEMSSAVVALVGLDSRPHFRPHLRSVASAAGTPISRVSATMLPAGSTGNPPGGFTVTDFANYYDVNPLYNQGVSGHGRKLAILTLASMTPSDAFAYWAAIGLNVDPNRLNIINIDGGPGAPSDDSGSLETTLDVEQSGGIAPGAKMTVYQAPNTNQAWIDMFATAVDANWADSFSVSWGGWEWLDNLENSPVTDPISGQTVGTNQATHEFLVRAAIQGESFYAAAGDGGAYDADGDGLGPPNFSLTLSVDYPASDTAITAGGGTTLASTQIFNPVPGTTTPFVITIPHERVWGWDWANPLCDAYGLDPYTDCGFFPGGGGGGVSVLSQLPFYQYGIRGVQRSQPDQDFIELLPPPAYLYFALPGNYPGRNVPDVSFDADPYTGYAVYYTSSVNGFGIEDGWGGTSFVGPQLNGCTALFGQYLHGRVGFMNIPLYNLVRSGQAYGGWGAPLHAIRYGDNWFYQGSNGYNPGAGVGTIDVANFAEALRFQGY